MVKNWKNEIKNEEMWTCLICGEENPSDEDMCPFCGACREEPSYDTIADEED